MEQQKQCMGCMEFYDEKLDVCPHCGYAEGTESSHVLHMTPGTLLHRRYVVGKSLGYGSFGVTYIAWDRMMKRKVALKEYLPSEYATRQLKEADLVISDTESQHAKFEKGMTKFRREAEKLAKVGNVDGVVYVYDTFEENNTAYIVMEYLQGETLASYLEREGPLSEEETLDLMLPVLQALEAVHEKDIIHRDISPDNLFLTVDGAGNRRIKLIDFGAARFATSSHSKSLTVLLRPGYSPEEQYRSSGEQGPHTDVYAIGAVMYQMVTGTRPPDALERRTAIERKKRDLLKEPSAYNPTLSDNFETAILNALNVKLEDRTPTADAFLGELVSFEKVKRRGSSIKRIDFLRWPLWAKIGVPSAGAAAIALLVGVSIWLAGLVGANEEFVMPENCTFVIDFIGATAQDAEEKAEEHDLVISQGATEYSPSMAPDLVLRQDRNAGSIVEKNTIVTLTISTGIETYTMPDVTGMHLSDARYALECMGIEVLTEEGAQGGLAANCVISQSIEPYADINYGETVTLTVTPEGENGGGTAPALTGLTYAEALAAAESAGVRLVVTEKVFSREYADPLVLEQSVAAGSPVNAGEAIQVTVALPWHTFTMPNLMYKSQETALQLLKNIGIQAEVAEAPSEVVARGLVFDQSVEKAAEVEPGQAVTLTVSSGSTPFAMPSVEGMTEEEARTTLTNSKLAVSVEYGYDETVAEGCVIYQSIAGGSDVTRGETVTIVVCSAEGLVAVPNVVGQTAEAAEAALAAQGLQMQKTEIYSATAPAGTVIEQLPAAGSMQKEGSLVTLTVSKGVDPATVQPQKPETPSGGNGNGGNGNGGGQTPSAPASWHWSDWSTTPSSGGEYETMMEYRYRLRETTTNENPSLEGWTLTGQSSYWDNWGGWSEWSETSVAGNDATDVQTKTQYRYRDLETTTDSSSSLSGWERVGGPDYGGWGNTQSSSSKPTESDTLRITSTEQTYWGYYHYANKYSDGTWGVDSIACGTSSHYHEFTSRSEFPAYSMTDQGGQQAYGGWVSGTCHESLGSKECGFTVWFRKSSLDSYTYYYQTRSVTYHYQRWGGWSGWSDTAYSASDTRQVETRTLYRSRTRVLHTVYQFERWGAWTDYSATPVTANANTEVQTRTLYRHKIYD